MNLDSDEDEFQTVTVPSRRQKTPASSEEPFTYLALLKEMQSAEPGYNGAVGKIKVPILIFTSILYRSSVLDQRFSSIFFFEPFYQFMCMFKLSKRSIMFSGFNC